MLVVETSVFTRQVQALLDDDDYRRLQGYLATRPDAGKLIPGAGGLRKLRWTAKGRGKRGGTRIIYFWADQLGRLLMLFIYSKSKHEDLTRKQLDMLRKVVEVEYP